jgi:nucleoid DNA-binding protein
MTKEDIARDLRDLLQFPPTRHRNLRCSTEYRVVGAVVQAMTEALLRGEEIRIADFGIFRIRTKKATRSPVPYSYKDIDDVVGNEKAPTYRGMWKIRDIPERKYVHFQPSKVLLRMINGNQQ